jgi:thioesterase domain-containing protein
MQRRDEQMEYVNVVTLRDSGGRIPLFCFPGAGGAVGIFGDIAASIGADRPVYGIDLQKCFDRDRKLTVEQLADECLPAIREKQERGPYFICGYSFGALIAYEVATRLRCIGEDIGVVGLIDTGNPAFRAQLSSARTKQLDKAYAANRLRKYFRILASGNIRTFASGLLAVFAGRAGVRTRRLVRHIFSAMNRPMPAVLRNNDRALFEAWIAYDPPPGALSLLLLYGEHRRSEYGGDRTLGWGTRTSGEVQVELAPEGHVEMMKAPHVFAFTAKLSECFRGTGDQ